MTITCPMMRCISSWRRRPGWPGGSLAASPQGTTTCSGRLTRGAPAQARRERKRKPGPLEQADMARSEALASVCRPLWEFRAGHRLSCRPGSPGSGQAPWSHPSWRHPGRLGEFAAVGGRCPSTGASRWPGRCRSGGWRPRAPGARRASHRPRPQPGARRSRTPPVVTSMRTLRRPGTLPGAGPSRPAPIPTERLPPRRHDQNAATPRLIHSVMWRAPGWTLPGRCRNGNAHHRGWPARVA